MLTPKAEAYLEECRQEAVDLLIRLAQICTRYFNMKYKNLFFDLDDTLWAFSQNAYDACQEIFSHIESWERKPKANSLIIY